MTRASRYARNYNPPAFARPYAHNYRPEDGPYAPTLTPRQIKLSPLDRVGCRLNWWYYHVNRRAYRGGHREDARLKHIANLMHRLADLRGNPATTPAQVNALCAQIRHEFGRWPRTERALAAGALGVAISTLTGEILL